MQKVNTSIINKRNSVGKNIQFTTNTKNDKCCNSSINNEMDLRRLYYPINELEMNKV